MSKKLLEAAKAVGSGGVYIASAAIFLTENLIFQKKKIGFFPEQKVFYTSRLISKANRVLDDALARDNVENDLQQTDQREI